MHQFPCAVFLWLQGKVSTFHDGSVKTVSIPASEKRVGEETRADKQGLIELSAAPVTRDTWRHARPGEDVLDERDGAGGDDGADVLLPRVSGSYIRAWIEG